TDDKSTRQPRRWMPLVAAITIAASVAGVVGFGVVRKSRASALPSRDSAESLATPPPRLEAEAATSDTLPGVNQSVSDTTPTPPPSALRSRAKRPRPQTPAPPRAAGSVAPQPSPGFTKDRHE